MAYDYELSKHIGMDFVYILETQRNFCVDTLEGGALNNTEFHHIMTHHCGF